MDKCEGCNGEGSVMWGGGEETPCPDCGGNGKALWDAPDEDERD